MILYTHHNPDFNLIGSKIDLNKSFYYSDKDMNMFKKAYDWLFKIIKTNQIVWTFPSLEDFCWTHGHEEKLWILDVPQEYIIGSIDMSVWTSVINGWHYIPEEVLENVKDDDIDLLMDEWEKSHDKETTWKEHLFDNTFKSQVIIKAPIKEEWVIDTRWFCGYETEKIEHEIQNCQTRSNEERDRMIEIYKAFLKGRKAEYTLEVYNKRYCFKWKFNE